jgi:NAD(P)-dependent dehydrogenase (short-subunit alcohol dehydrogenase family)
LQLLERFAKEDFKVALLSRKLENVSELAKEVGENATAVECDVTNTESIRKAYEQIEKLGIIDTVVYNAGSGGKFCLFVDFRNFHNSKILFSVCIIISINLFCIHFEPTKYLLYLNCSLGKY